MPLLVSNAISHLKGVHISSGLRTIAAKHRGKLSAEVFWICFPFFARFSSSKSSFSWLSQTEITYSLQNYPHTSKSFTLSVLAPFRCEIQCIRLIGYIFWYDPDIFLIRISIRIFFYPDSYGIDKREVYLDKKNYPTLYLSDSHPLSVNIAQASKRLLFRTQALRMLESKVCFSSKPLQRFVRSSMATEIFRLAGNGGEFYFLHAKV